MSSSSTSNTENSEDAQKDKIEGFHVISLDDVSKYDIPKDRASYVNECISNFIPGNELQDSI